MAAFRGVCAPAALRDTANLTRVSGGETLRDDATLAASVASEARPGALEPGLAVRLRDYFCAGPLQLNPWFAPA